MKKLLTMVFVLLAILAVNTSVKAQTESQNTGQTSVSKINYSLKLQSETSKRIMYQITFTELDQASISRLINRMYSSSSLAVISRLNDNNELEISTPKSVSLNELNKELARLIELTKNDADKSPVKF